MRYPKTNDMHTNSPQHPSPWSNCEIKGIGESNLLKPQQ